MKETFKDNTGSQLKGFSRSFDPPQEYCAHLHSGHLPQNPLDDDLDADLDDDDRHDDDDDDDDHADDDMPRKVQRLHFPEIANLVPGTESLSSPYLHCYLNCTYTVAPTGKKPTGKKHIKIAVMTTTL